MGRPEREIPTDWELFLLHTLWEHGPAKVDDIREILRSQNIKRSESSLRTILLIMQNKGLVHGVLKDRITHYEPLVSRPIIEKRFFHHMVQSLFKGKQEEFLLRALDESNVNEDVVNKMKEKIKEFKDRNKNG
jgi:BlaI family transcriptional regulator, penicillinase repressor